MIIGRLLGALFGSLLTGGPFGLILGFFLGYTFDKSYRTVSFFTGSQQNEVKAAFFKATFSVMGYLAKVDGHVSRAEIAQAEKLFSQMNLDTRAREQAIAFFNLGKSPEFDINAALDEFLSICRHQRILLQLFIECLYQAVVAEPNTSHKKLSVLEKISLKIGYHPAFMHFNTNAGYQQYSGQHSQSQYRSAPKYSLSDDYALLEITPDAAPTDIKKAYRRVMSKHHPDKLIAQGLPENMIKIATDKSQQIQAAYERIRQARGLT